MDVEYKLEPLKSQQMIPFIVADQELGKALEEMEKLEEELRKKEEKKP